MILRSKWMIDRSLEVHEDGILDTGDHSRKIIDLGDSILMPGLFNAHVHLDYTFLRGQIPFNSSFTDWIRRIVQKKREWNEADFSNSIAAGLEESASYGTTSMVNWLSHPTTLPSQATAMRIWWLWEQIAFHPNAPRPDWNAWANRAPHLSPLWKGGLAPHAPYTCQAQAIHEAIDWSSKHRLPWSIHVAESKEEEIMFSQSQGPLFDFLNSIGHDLSDFGRHSPLAHLKTLLLRSQSPVLLVHANLLSKSDLHLLKSISSKVMLSIVHCPRSHQFFNHPPFPLELLRKAGISLCLGTDSLASNHDLSMFREMTATSKVYADLAPNDIVAMATLHGACAVGMEKEWHLWQDWIAIPAPNSRNDLWPSIVNFTGRPHFVMVNNTIQKILA